MIVVHSETSKIGCGIITPTSGEIVSLGAYPDYQLAGGLNASGTFLVEQTNSAVTITGTLGGVEPNVIAGIHIHSGYTCDDASGVGGHYYEDMSDDPWTTTYTSDSKGSAVVDMTIDDFSLDLDYPTAYRTLVVHSTASKIGCGIISSEAVSIENATSAPTSSPTLKPSSYPTLKPSSYPTLQPNPVPTSISTEDATSAPTSSPTTRDVPTIPPTYYDDDDSHKHMKKHLNKFKTAAYVSIGIGSACFVGCLLYLVKVFCCTKKKAEDGNVQAKVMDMNPDANVV